MSIFQAGCIVQLCGNRIVAGKLRIQFRYGCRRPYQRIVPEYDQGKSADECPDVIPVAQMNVLMNDDEHFRFAVCRLGSNVNGRNQSKDARYTGILRDINLRSAYFPMQDAISHQSSVVDDSGAEYPHSNHCGSDEPYKIGNLLPVDDSRFLWYFRDYVFRKYRRFSFSFRDNRCSRCSYARYCRCCRNKRCAWRISRCCRRYILRRICRCCLL